jgi:energy-coupling factor transport system ATP-binding protein
MAMPLSVHTRRWCGGIGSGKSAALRDAVSQAIAEGIRPIAFLPAVTDVGLRTERIDLLDIDVAKALGADALIGRLARNLSSGERQRVRLASALSRSVRFAALDEPCRHLDPEHVEALSQVLATRTADGMQLAVCDSRELLAATLFEQEIGADAEDRPRQDASTPPCGEPLGLDVPIPFLLSAVGRASGMQRVEVERGALIAVRGPNGSGKTSLLEALSRSARAAGMRSGISRQEPEHQVFSSTPAAELAEVSSGRHPSPWGGDDTIANLQLGPWLSSSTPRLPLGVLSLLGAAIALRMGSDLVLLDEPTQGLDPGAARTLARELLRCARSGARIVVASHDPELVSVANHRWSIHAGVLNTRGES